MTGVYLKGINACFALLFNYTLTIENVNTQYNTETLPFDQRTQWVTTASRTCHFEPTEFIYLSALPTYQTPQNKRCCINFWISSASRAWSVRWGFLCCRENFSLSSPCPWPGEGTAGRALPRCVRALHKGHCSGTASPQAQPGQGLCLITALHKPQPPLHNGPSWMGTVISVQTAGNLPDPVMGVWHSLVYKGQPL